MLRGQTLDAAIFNQARERPFQGPVSIRRFGWLDELPVRELMNAGAVPKRRIDAKSNPGPPPCRYPAPRLARGCEWLCEPKSL